MENFWRTRFGRRDLLKYAGIGALAVAVETACSNLPKKAPTAADYERQAELTRNPVFRAASVLITTSTNLGHGGIFRDGENLYLLTQKHIVPDKNERPSCLIPGLGTDRFTIDSTWEPLSEEPDDDPNIRFLLQGTVAQSIETAIKNGALISLSYFCCKIQDGNKFALPMPNNGEISYITYSGYDQYINELIFKAKNGYSCNGFSGTPILAIDENNNLLPESVGLKKSSTPDRMLFPSEECSNDFYFAKPHTQWVVGSTE